jgi:hypothetical protein
MLPRLLYAAVGLCLLGTRPEHAAPRAAPTVQVSAPAPAAPAMTPRPPKAAAIDGAPADFAIPRIQR